ncbi:MAG: alanine--tRNA ligase, partial [Fidelibacterota bacterium]
MKTSSEIRDDFVKFFLERGHHFVPGSSIIPFDDPTLLFTNAGMNQFKNILLGLEKPKYLRVANFQKCIRVSGKHNDLEEVGKDTYHHTFFEMLGNWSFGDYYKREAIQYAWELLTEVWNLSSDRIWATVFNDDDEAAVLWEEETNVPSERILRFDEKENFWEMGATGPCGPCSEVHYDRGKDFGCGKPECGVNTCSCGRFIELWNLVFIQFNRDEGGNLHELPIKHVDTGAGLERIVSVLQGVESNYSTDLFMPIIERVEEYSKKEFKGDNVVAFRVIADHIRTLSFAITDGVIPSNVGRGYVVRRILRRASRFGRILGLREPFLYRLVPVIAGIMGDAYPDMKAKIDHAELVIKAEEESFGETIDRGIEQFEIIAKRVLSSGSGSIPGEDVFKLYDTYGFPVDLTGLMAEEKGLRIDQEGFEKEMERQRQRARAAGKWRSQSILNLPGWITLTGGKDSEFKGYERLKMESVVRRYLLRNNRIFVILDKTPFYAESGGQVADKGLIAGENFSINVGDVFFEGETIIHEGDISLKGEIKNPSVIAEVDSRLRKDTALNHTATHLLHAALREVLGKHVHQAGSLVAPDRLRFDLTHFYKIKGEEIERIEAVVNEKIREDIPLNIYNTTFKEARSSGAIALFGEKYGEDVRVVEIPGVSMELCGGTHIQRTGEIGMFIILNETGIASGIRRVEAVTGRTAYEYFVKQKRDLEKLSQFLNVSKDEIVNRIEKLAEVKKRVEKELEQYRFQSALDRLDQFIKRAGKFNGISIVAEQIEIFEIEDLKKIGDVLRQKIKSGIGIIGAACENKVSVVCVVTDDLIKQRGIRAKDVVKLLGMYIGGGGGGRDHIATA